MAETKQICPTHAVTLPHGGIALCDPSDFRYLLLDEAGLGVSNICETPINRIVRAMREGPYRADEYAEALGISERQIEDWHFKSRTTGGLDMRGRIEIPVGATFTSCGTEAVAVDWIAPDHQVLWVPDWKQGELMAGRYQAGYGSPRKQRQQMENFYANLPRANPDNGVLKMKMPEPGKPALCLACGPSQRDAWPYLQGDHTVITCNRGMQLMDPGLIDYYVAVDHVARESWLQDADKFTGQAAIWLSAHPMFAEKIAPEKLFWFASPLVSPDLKEESEIRPKLGWIAGGTTVAMHMMHFAYYHLKADPIILAGYDLCAVDDCYYPDVPLAPENMPFPEIDYTHDKKIRISCKMFQSQRRQVDAAIWWIAKGKTDSPDRCRVINTSRGIVLNGDHMPMEQAAKECLGY